MARPAQLKNGPGHPPHGASALPRVDGKAAELQLKHALEHARTSPRRITRAPMARARRKHPTPPESTFT